MVAGSISLPSKGFFSPFPRGTSSLSVVNEYLALSGGPDGFTQSFTCNALLGIPRVRLYPVKRLSRSLAPFSNGFAGFISFPDVVPLPREDKSSRFGLFRFRSPLPAESLCFLFLGLLRCFTSPRVAAVHYEFMSGYPFAWMGFPIRNLTGQSLFAARRKLSQLTTSFIAY